MTMTLASVWSWSAFFVKLVYDGAMEVADITLYITWHYLIQTVDGEFSNV